MRRTLLLSIAASLSLLACSKGVIRDGATADVGKCDVVRAVLEEHRAASPSSETLPLVVYLRPPGASWVERFFENEPFCEIDGYVLQQEPAEDTWALFLVPQGTGYGYELQKGDGGVPVPTAKGMPTQRVIPSSSGRWFAFD